MKEYIEREKVLELVEPDARPFLAERIRNLPSAAVQPVKWTSVKERLPKDHERVLVVNDDGKMMTAERAEDDWWYYYCAYDVDRWWIGTNGEIIAWTQLPEPPKDGET